MMLLCDHTVFWHRHHQQPFVQPGSIQLASDLTEVFNKDGKKGVRRWLDALRKEK